MPENSYPSWGMISLCVSFLALLITVGSAKKQSEVAEKCLITPKR